VTGRSEPIDPRSGVEESRAPAREQLPLPRRRQQAHIEPQLREPNGAGAGTPFSAFSAPQSDPSDGAPRPADAGPSSAPGSAVPDNSGDPTELIPRLERPADRVAAFRAATRRVRRPGQRPRPSRG
jgi:hypothetical protein